VIHTLWLRQPQTAAAVPVAWCIIRASDSLIYTLGTLGISPEQAVVDRVVAAYNALTPYPEAAEALTALADYRLAILSNGSPDMLNTLVENSCLDGFFEAVISVSAKQTYKPDPRAYELVQERLGVRPEEVVFVTSNGFDAAGARSFGFKVARIERTTPSALKRELLGDVPVGAGAMFRALRTQTEELDYVADAVVESLLALPGLIPTFAA